jgi:type IV pilus assembly protein PilY1
VITDPAFTTSGLVFYTTYKPYSEECFIGGKGFLWAVNAETGGAGTTDQLQGKVLVQLSTGSIEQINLKDAMKEMQDRRSGALEGEPPRGQGIAVVSSPPPTKRVLQIKER